MKLKDLNPSDKDIRQAAKNLNGEFIDITNAPEDVKKRVRIKNNNLLSKLLDKFKISHGRKKLRNILNNDKIPEYENAITVGNKHINYHNTGFHGGIAGKDTTNQLNVVQAFRFLQ